MTMTRRRNTEPHLAEQIFIGYRDDEPVYRDLPCGEYWAGTMQLCDDCDAYYAEQYPQGWSHYPGDVCMHGQYTGGCGIDYMCHHCEMGMTESFRVERHRVILSVNDVRIDGPRIEGWDTNPLDLDLLWGRIKTWLTETYKFWPLCEMEGFTVETWCIVDAYYDWREPS